MYDNIECLEQSTDDFEIKDCFHNNVICCFGDELVYYWFTSTNYNLNLIISMIKQETDKKDHRVTKRNLGSFSFWRNS